MKNKLKLGDKVIVNTGGSDSFAYIDNPIKNIHGFYWEEQDSYLCRFTDDSSKLLCNGATIFSPSNTPKKNNFVCTNAQYIPSKYIKKH